MQVIFLLIFLGAVVAVGFLVAFFISIKNGQFDDDKTPAMRILFDDKPAKEENLEEDYKE
jgi:cbb3-type cytochrome oxidase maturation protein